MNCILRVAVVELISDGDGATRWWSPWLAVVRSRAETIEPHEQDCLPQFYIMCSAVMSDIQSPGGSGATALREIAEIESGNAVHIESDGNAWVTHVTPTKVWFEGLYEQADGGEVSLGQYKLAVESYVRFLADPERKPIEVPFPN
jgi:hypothetical protein